MYRQRKKLPDALFSEKTRRAPFGSEKKPDMKIIALKENRDFQRLYRGKFAAGAVLVTYAQKSKREGIRIGITTGKKIGGAVQRNRCRRIIRAAYRELAKQCSGKWDIVFVAREKTVPCKMQEVQREMRGQLKKLGVYVPNQNV